MGRMRAKSLAPLGKVAAQPTDEVTIKLLKTVLCCPPSPAERAIEAFPGEPFDLQEKSNC